MNHINFGRLLALVLIGAGGAFAAAFSAYLGSHPLPPDASAGALLANVNAAAFDAAQKAIGAAALALIAGLTRTDQGVPANGLRPADAPIAEQPSVQVEVGAEMEKRLAAAFVAALKGNQQ